ncbi:hypothetical protein V6N13_059007 [Hibiscus sabdariffa]|uniref:Uncharacterized protein n=1 Tax=Hibiscus sabdariffa TaxID=183260 RepID=A0ABR2GEE6_9ROSI
MSNYSDYPIMFVISGNNADIPTNPRKHRRLEEKSPDEGNPGDRPIGSDMNVDEGKPSVISIPSYKDSLLHGTVASP